MKKRGMRAIAILLCVAMTAVSLTACGQGGGKGYCRDSAACF